MEPIIQLNSQANLSEHLASPSEATLGHSNKLDGSHLSPHFKLGEMTKSNSHPEVYNIPSHEAIANLKRVCGWCTEFEPPDGLCCRYPGDGDGATDTLCGNIAGVCG